ncbi:MAG: DUF456 domain-containing protein [Planctomycetes bacterium]|nr:DUF456 domain-containing protein [Planctomycetota bacterium]MCH9727152.1 DUF456 domain-containing protein [Planctomycetota bacterium]MCH9778545.1 DUF456 domain-containing protein [Planctomycetota bacterium]MCH9791143.1 DUF456 domain-containing protein [Planctomycetota bacterium]
MSFEWLYDWVPFTFYYLMAVLLLLANLTAWVSILFLIPGNWIVVFLSALFYVLMPVEDYNGLSLTVILIAAALAGVGELVELLGGSAGAAKKGASRRAMILSLLATFVGSLVGATIATPIVPPIGTIGGAILGGALGAYMGAYLGEMWKGNQDVDRGEISRAAFIGRILGVVGKMAIGVIIIVMITIDSFI